MHSRAARMPQLNESQRVDSLHRLNLLDTPPEAAFDRVAAAAASICETPVSLVSLLDTERQWFKANVGLNDVDQTPRSIAFCDYTIQSDGLLHVSDASEDQRFCRNPLVTGEQEKFRFYAGHPLCLGNGAVVGTLCVIDRVPRTLDQKQKRALAELAQVVVTLLDDRFNGVSSHHSQQQQTALRRSQQLLAQTGMLANVGGWELDIATQELRWTDQTCIIHGLVPGHRPIAGNAIGFYAPEARSVITNAVRHAIKTGEGWDLELPFIRADNKRIWVRSQGTAVREGNRSIRLIGAIQDITEQTQQRQALEQAHERVTIATRNGRIGVWDWNVIDNELSWSAEMFELYGVDGLRDRVSYDLWHRCVHPDDRDAAAAELQLAIEHHDSVDCEFRVQWPDGSTRYLRSVGNVKRDASGKVTRVLGVNWDVTPLRKLSNELVEQHELLRVTLQSIGDAIVTTDASGEVSWMNPVAEKMTGWSVSSAVGRSLNDIVTIVDSDSREPLQNPIDTCLTNGTAVRLDGNAVLRSRDGVEYGVKETAAPIRNQKDEILGAVLVFHDVTETRRLSDEMSFRATHDQLTGLFNRPEFEAQLESRRQNQPARQGSALMVIDLDQFKLVNDACGHAVGDQLLFQVAQLLRQCVRGSDTLARLGADEFAVLLDDCNTSGARRIAQRICESVDEYRFIHNGQRFRIGASIGLVPFDHRWNSIAAAMQAADVSCHAAKESGRNRVHEWHDGDEQIQARHDDMQWASRLETAIDEDRFVLYAQCIGVASGQSDGLYAEALIRLRDSDDQLVLPNAFFPAAERLHLCTRIDRWVLKHAIDQLRCVPDISVVRLLCINLSGQSVGDREFHRQAIELLKQAGTDICKRICLEITETVAVTNIADASAFVSQVRELGVRVALDDFGAGASSFGYLRMLDADILKIDGQFITGMIDDKLNAAAVRCFVDVAKTLGLSTVAEFVNSPEILDRVRELGIDYAQGYLLHKPAPMAEVLSAVAESGCQLLAEDVV